MYTWGFHVKVPYRESTSGRGTFWEEGDPVPRSCRDGYRRDCVGEEVRVQIGVVLTRAPTFKVVLPVGLDEGVVVHSRGGGTEEGDGATGDPWTSRNGRGPLLLRRQGFGGESTSGFRTVLENSSSPHDQIPRHHTAPLVNRLRPGWTRPEHSGFLVIPVFRSS